MKEFKCSHCQREFNSDWTEKEAWAEFIKEPRFVCGEPVVIVCDDCYLEFKEWMDSLTDEEHQEMRVKTRSN